MSTYAWPGEHEIARIKRARAALEGIGYLTTDDMLALMGADPLAADKEDRRLARSDLRAMGYEKRQIALYGIERRLFIRWVSIARSKEWYQENLPGRDWRPPSAASACGDAAASTSDSAAKEQNKGDDDDGR